MTMTKTLFFDTIKNNEITENSSTDKTSTILLNQARTYAMLAKTMKSSHYLKQSRKCLEILKNINLTVKAA